jgi:hypothetical protein
VPGVKRRQARISDVELVLAVDGADRHRSVGASATFVGNTAISCGGFGHKR